MPHVNDHADNRLTHSVLKEARAAARAAEHNVTISVVKFAIPAARANDTASS